MYRALVESAFFFGGGGGICGRFKTLQLWKFALYSSFMLRQWALTAESQF